MKNEQELFAALRTRFSQEGAWLLGVDGDQRAGKTSLATRLADILNSTVISADDFFRWGTRPYPDALDLSALSSAISDLRNNGKSAIVESVMLKLILEATNIQPTAILYVRHVSPCGQYTQAKLFDAATLRAAIDEDDKFDKCFFPDRKYPSLDTEILRYHENKKPHSSADYVFDNCFAYGS